MSDRLLQSVKEYKMPKLKNTARISSAVLSHKDVEGPIYFDAVAVKAAYDSMVLTLLDNALKARGVVLAADTEANAYVVKKAGLPPLGGFYLKPTKVKAPKPDDAEYRAFLEWKAGMFNAKK